LQIVCQQAAIISNTRDSGL